MNDMTNKCCEKCFSTYTEHDYQAHTTVYGACICIDTLCKCHSNEKDRDLALTIASRMGSMIHPNDFGDSIVETAKVFKAMTGEDLGIKRFERTNRRIKNIGFINKIRNFLTPNKLL